MTQEDGGKQLSWSTFVVDVRPRAMWGWELLDQNLKFLEGLDPSFFTYAFEAHSAALGGASSQHAAMAIRLIYGQAVETLFALLGAAIQAPNCPLGWIVSYSGRELHSVVRKIHEASTQTPLLAREEVPQGWTDVSRIIHRFSHEDPREDARIKGLFADTWTRLAHEFLSPLTGEEYNSIKHGSRARAGGWDLTLGVGMPDGPKIESRSEFGSRFFHVLPLGDKINFHAEDAMRNWTPVALGVRIELIAVSIQNIIAYLRLCQGGATGQVRYQWPEPSDALALAWHDDFLFETGSGGYPLEASDITPRSKTDILRAYDPPHNSAT